jgi:hypothetical protein
MSALFISSDPKVRRQIIDGLTDAANEAGVMNKFGNPSPSVLMLRIYFAFEKNPAKTVELLEQLAALGREGHLAHFSEMSSRAGRPPKSSHISPKRPGVDRE